MFILILMFQPKAITNIFSRRKHRPQPYLSQAFHNLKYPTEKSALVAHTPLDIWFLLFLSRVEVRLRNEQLKFVSLTKHTVKIKNNPRSNKS